MHDVEEFVDGDRLGDVVRRAGADRLLTVADHRLGRERDDRQVGETFLTPYHLHGRVAVHAGHHDVHQDEFYRRLGHQHVDTVLTVLRDQHLQTLRLEHAADREKVAGVVVDDEHASPLEHRIYGQGIHRGAERGGRRTQHGSMKEEGRYVEQLLRIADDTDRPRAAEGLDALVYHRVQLIAFEHHQRERSAIIEPAHRDVLDKLQHLISEVFVDDDAMNSAAVEDRDRVRCATRPDNRDRFATDQ